MKRFSDFLREHVALAVFTVVTVLITYGTYLINAEDILTDMETYIIHQADTLSVFEKVGRFGLFVTKKLFSTDTFIPAVFICYMMLAMCLTGLFFDFCIHEIVLPENRKKALLFSVVFNGFFLSCPVLVHQFYFYYQAFEVAFAFFLGIFASYAVHVWAYRKRNIFWLALGLGAMIWSFGTYQVLVPFYIAANVAFYIADYLYGQKREDYFAVCVKLVLVFLAGLFGYFACSRVWVLLRYHMVSSHLSDTYTGWGNMAVPECVELIKVDLRRVFRHESPAFSKGYPVLTVLFAALAVYKGIRAKKKKTVLFLAAVAVFVASPFFMTFLLGNCQMLRAHLVYPLVFAATAGFVMMMLPESRLVKYPVLLMMGILFCSQIDVSNRYEQTVHFVAEADKNLAERIYARAETVAAGKGESFTMAFTGTYRPPHPDSYFGQWDAAGISFFEIDSTKAHGSARIVCMMKSIGLEVEETPEDRYGYACQRAEDMPVWPAEGSVVYEDGMVIVKMSE